LNNQLNLGYALLNRGGAQWNLGHQKEATTDMEQASDIAKKDDASYKPLHVAIELAQAEMALSERRFSDVIADVDRAFEITGSQTKAAGARGKSLKGLAQALSGNARAGQVLCREAVTTAAVVGDPMLSAEAQLALAEASLVAGDAKSALEAAQQAQNFFTDSGMTERNWRALLIAGMASQKLLNLDNARNYFKMANEAFSSLEQKWGADTFKAYQARPDIQFYRKQLEQESASLR